jgi:diguanylate cyclase (GGDEF)-like protein
VTNFPKKTPSIPGPDRGSGRPPDAGSRPAGITGNKEQEEIIPEDNYKKVLDRVFLVSEKLIILDGIDEVFEHIIKTIIILTSAEAATMRIFNMEKGTLEMVKGYGLSGGFFKQPSVRIGEGVIGRAVFDGTPYSIADVSRDAQCVKKELAGLENIRAIICVPLKVKDSNIGCLTVYKRNPGAFTGNDLLSLDIIAAQAAAAIEKSQIISELQKQACYDHLTGTYNKNAILKHGEAQLDLSRRHKQSTSLIFLDIDHFKAFNDTYGHLLGDKLLGDFAKVLKKCCRKSDMLGRFGGEEFLIIASQTPKEDAYALGIKLKGAVNKYKFLGSGSSRVRVTFSAGIASFPEDGSDINELLKKADQAMYKGKSEGRDMITLFQDNMTSVL